MIILSAEQTKVFDSIMEWYKGDEQIFVLAGYAGTGKTTLAKYIAKEIGGVHFCAYTGKASQVLRDKGCAGATTIHGVLYKPVSEDAKEPEFVYEPSDQVLMANLVIVDEYSMLTPDLIDDLLRAGKRILFLGDPFQLPPIGDDNGLRPNLFMEEIHRQALDSPIIRYATDVRQMKHIPYVRENGFSRIPQAKVDPELFFKVSQIIVGYNATRTQWNKRYRQRLGFTSELPVKGDKMICLRNNKQKLLFNGLIGEAKADSIRRSMHGISLDFEEWKDLKIWDGDVLGKDFKEAPKEINRMDRFDFAYAITCHKSQGSEFDSIVVYNQPIGKTREERARWLYTAITRAKQECTIVEPSR